MKCVPQARRIARVGITDCDTLVVVGKVSIMPRFDYRKIEKDPTRCGGQAVVVGTRIRVATILICHRLGMSIEEIMQQYPSLKPADVHDALAYAYDHEEELEADIAGDEEAAVKAKLAAQGVLK